MISKILLKASLPILLVLSSSLYSESSVRAQSEAPAVFVWSNLYQNSNVTDAVNLIPPRTFSIQVNMTGAANFVAFDLLFLYDADFISALSVDFQTNTIFGDQVIELRKDTSTPGEIHIAASLLGQPNGFTGNGTLANISFRVKGVGASPLALTEVEVNRVDAGKITPQLPSSTMDGYFKNTADKSGPVAEFTFSPSSPVQGGLVKFNASLSFDSDNRTGYARGIWQFTWFWGDGQIQSFIAQNRTHVNPDQTNQTAHTFGTAQQAFHGVFWVRLKVTDSEGFEGLKIVLVRVSERPLHDLGISAIGVQPNRPPINGTVTVKVSVRNYGTFNETYDLTFLLEGTVVHQFTRESLGGGETSRVFTYDINTSGFVPRHYEVKARIDVAVDEQPANNSRNTFFTVGRLAASLLPFLAALVAVVGGGIGGGLFLRRRVRPIP